MATNTKTNTYRFNATVAVENRNDVIPEVTNSLGVVISPQRYGKRHIAPGEPIELDEAEGNRLLKIVGMYVQPGIIR